MAVTPDPRMEHDPQLAAVYRAGAGEEPPAHLDAAIRAAARREVSAAPERLRSRRWMVPVSLAAVMVLSVSVVLMMQQEGAERLDPAVPQSPRGAIPAAADAEATTDAAGKPAERVKPPPAPAQPSAAIRPGPAQSAPAAAPPPDTKQRADAGGSRMQESMAVRPKAAADANPPASEPEARRERPVATPPERTLLRSAPASGTAAATGERPAGRPAPAATLADEAASSTALWRDLIDAPPGKWIDRIAELRRDGRMADADTLTAEFRRRYPAERVPDALR